MSAPRNKGNGKAINFLRALISHEGDACVTWPYAVDRHGYGHLGHLGKQRMAHRLLCVMVHGEPPSEAHHASHSCGNGHKGCVNPRHLSWKTASDNCLDRRGHGTHATNKTGSRTPLSEETRDRIKTLDGKLPRIHIATQFGISRQTVKRIIDGRQYKQAGTHRETLRKRRLKEMQQQQPNY